MILAMITVRFNYAKQRLGLVSLLFMSEGRIGRCKQDQS